MNKKYEDRQLSNIASHGNYSKGRKYKDSKLQFNRTEYQRDRDRIIHSIFQQFIICPVFAPINFIRSSRLPALLVSELSLEEKLSSTEVPSENIIIFRRLCSFRSVMINISIDKL